MDFVNNHIRKIVFCLVVLNACISFNSYSQSNDIKIEFTKLNSTDRSIGAPQTPNHIQFTKATFLPEDYWMVFNTNYSQGSLDGYRHLIKLYEPGTFQNRFSKLDYKRYLEANHSTIDFGASVFKVNKNTGIHPFYGYEIKAINENVYGFYAYDLVKDEVFKISTLETNHRQILDYDVNNNRLLLSIQEYYNSGYTDPQSFIILKDNTITEIEGKYKFGKFSNDGDYILLISDTNELQLKTLEDLKTIFTEQLVDAEYTITSFGTNEFAVGVDFFTYDFNKCNQESILVYKDDAGAFQSKKTDCALITDMTTTEDDKIAMISGGLGMAIGNEILRYEPTEFPEMLSFNTDASRLMVSFNNGKILILNPNTTEVLGAMQHPDNESHVFYDAKGNYFSNVDPNDYLQASKGSSKVAFKTLEDTYFNPEKILSVFGKPDPEYVALLKKALALKEKNKFETTELEVKTAEPSEGVAGKGDLYVLSVGVSDYQQSDFNLTFADKDALDIAKIYGQLSQSDLAAYKRKFFGNSFILNNSNDSFKGEIRKYLGKYKPLMNLKALTTDGNFWLEAANDEFFIWDFKSGTMVPIALPNGVRLDSYNFEPVLFASPNNDGFYVRDDNNDYYAYLFSNSKFEKINVPKKLAEAPVYSTNLAFLNDKYWAYFSGRFDGSSSEISVFKGRINEDHVDVVSFNPNIFRLSQENDTQIDSLDIYSTDLKAMSTNGTHVLYGTIAGDLFYKDLSRSEDLPQKIDIETIKNLDLLSIAEDGKTFSVVTSNADDVDYKIESYNLSGELVDTKILGNNVVGFSDYNNHLNWIVMSDPLVEEEFLSTDDLLEVNQPHSFNKTFVSHLVNAEATSKEITEAIVKVFENAKPEDQIVLFLAGHGVLDNELNYYYAAHDMDFNNAKANGVGFKTIVELLNSSNANNKLLLMDTCHSGNTLDIETSTATVKDDSNNDGQRGSKSRSTDPKSKFKLSDVVSDVFEDFLSKSGITVISASSGEDVAYENKTLGNGAFTSAYINLLKEKLKAGGFVLTEDKLKMSVPLTDDAITELLKQVMILTNGKQTPDLRELPKATRIKMW